MQCLNDLGAGNYRVMVPQPDDYTTCINVLASPSEIHAELFTISLADAITILPYMAAVLVVGFTIRVLARTLNTDERFQNEE